MLHYIFYNENYSEFKRQQEEIMQAEKVLEQLLYCWIATLKLAYEQFEQTYYLVNPNLSHLWNGSGWADFLLSLSA